MLKRRTLIEFGLAAALVGVVAWFARIANEQVELGFTDGAGWTPMAWPLPRDAWPDGRAWSRHGTEVHVRVKRGLCSDCQTGVISDEALQRASDIDLLDPAFVPAEPGRRIRVTDLFGRARFYRRTTWYGARRTAQAIAVSHKCDLVIFLVAGDLGDAATLKSARAFLESNTPQVWINRQLEAD